MHREHGTPLCSKYRSAHGAQMAHFGVAELYGFLGVWIQHADKHKDRKGHIAFRPSVVQIRKYIEDKGWPIR